jgi:hypothetical protein
MLADFIRLLPSPHKSLRPELAFLLLLRGPTGLEGKLRWTPSAPPQSQILRLQLGDPCLQSLYSRQQATDDLKEFFSRGGG